MTAPLTLALKAQDEAQVRKHGPALAVLKSPTEDTLVRRAALVLPKVGAVETELLLRVWWAIHNAKTTRVRVEVAS